MHFFSFHMTDDCKRTCFESGHRYMLFSITDHTNGHGVPIYQAVASGDTSAILNTAAIWFHNHRGRGEGVRAYVIYETEEVRKGVALGNQELRAEDN